MDFSRLAQAHITFDGRPHTCYFRQDSSDKKVIDQIFNGQAYELRGLARFEEIREAISAQAAVGKAPLIIDAGANIGISAFFFANNYPGSVVYAIEPEKSNFELLVENTKGLKVICVQAALSDKPGRVRIVDEGEGNWGFRTEMADQLEGSIPAITMDDIIEQELLDDRWLLMAKIDIEGAEAAVFEGHPAWIKKVPVLIVELHDWLFPKKGTSRSFMKSMAAEEDIDIVPMGENMVVIRHKLI
jgi:FkbM family methyltransferase